MNIPRSFPLTSTYAKGVAVDYKSSERLWGNVGAPQNSKAKKKWKASWEDQFERTVKCMWCPDWQFEGDGEECREALSEHRLNGECNKP